MKRGSSRAIITLPIVAYEAPPDATHISINLWFILFIFMEQYIVSRLHIVPVIKFNCAHMLDYLNLMESKGWDIAL